MPTPPAKILALLGLFTLGLRLMTLRQAHTLAEHERHSHRGRAQTFEALHQEQSPRR